MIKPEIDLELSIKALKVYGIEPNIIESMLTNLQKVVKNNSVSPHHENLFPTYEEMQQMAFNFRPQRGNLGVFWRDGFRECYLWLNELIKKS
jgi:hypothetical protein